MRATMNTIRNAGLLTVLLTMALVAAPERAEAQQRSTAPIFVAIPETFPDLDAKSILLRHPGRDIVLLDPSDPSPEALSAALGLLRRMRNEDPTPARAQMIPITGFAFRTELSENRRASMESVLERLMTRPIASVGNLGPGRSMRLQD